MRRDREHHVLRWFLLLGEASRLRVDLAGRPGALFYWIHAEVSKVTGMREAMLALLHRETAQNSLEYMLVLGSAVVLIMIAVIAAFPPVVQGLAGAACPSVDTAADPAPTYRSCLVVP